MREILRIGPGQCSDSWVLNISKSKRSIYLFRLHFRLNQQLIVFPTSSTITVSTVVRDRPFLSLLMMNEGHDVLHGDWDVKWVLNLNARGNFIGEGWLGGGPRAFARAMIYHIL